MANKRRPHNSASCNGYKWRLCAPLIPSGIIARPSPSIHVSRVKRGDRERETRRGDEKNTGVTTINRFERRIDRKFSVPKHPVFRSTSDLGRRTYLERIHEFFPIVVRTCKWWSKAGTSTYTYIYIFTETSKHSSPFSNSNAIFIEKVNKATFHFFVSRKEKPLD